MRISQALLNYLVNARYTSIVGPTGVGKSSVSVKYGIKDVNLT